MRKSIIRENENGTSALNYIQRIIEEENPRAYIGEYLMVLEGKHVPFEKLEETKLSTGQRVEIYVISGGG